MRTTTPTAAARLLASALALSLALAAPLAAQQEEEQQRRVRVDLTGRVVDSRSGAPIANAVVEIERHRRSVVTDTAGRFLIDRIPPGEQEVVVSRLGYIELTERVPVTEAGGSTEIRLVAQPLVLERINVYTDRLESRRRSSPYSVRAIKDGEIMSAGASTVADVVGRRLLYRTTCANMTWNCTFFRGRRVGVRVYVDEVPAIGGLEQLQTYYPQDVWLIESYNQGTMIRVYTKQYMDWLARTNRSPDPIVWR